MSLLVKNIGCIRLIPSKGMALANKIFFVGLRIGKNSSIKKFSKLFVVDWMLSLISSTTWLTCCTPHYSFVNWLSEPRINWIGKKNKCWIPMGYKIWQTESLSWPPSEAIVPGHLVNSCYNRNDVKQSHLTVRCWSNRLTSYRQISCGHFLYSDGCTLSYIKMFQS